MLTNEIKKGARIKLANGWLATIQDSKKGNIRFAEVEGFVKELGSIYAHDIVGVKLETDPKFGVQYEIDMTNGVMWAPVEHTPTQLKLKKTVESWF